MQKSFPKRIGALFFALAQITQNLELNAFLIAKHGNGFRKEHYSRKKRQLFKREDGFYRSSLIQLEEPFSRAFGGENLFHFDGTGGLPRTLDNVQKQLPNSRFVHTKLNSHWRTQQDCDFSEKRIFGGLKFDSNKRFLSQFLEKSSVNSVSKYKAEKMDKKCDNICDAAATAGNGCCKHDGFYIGKDWKAPEREGKLITGLMVNNSMTGGKTEFIPQEGNSIRWYGCGPTVYDSAHMGHARNYVTFDVLRRICSDYLGYDVCFVMNITDIDDKIIKRSNEQGVNFSELARHWEAEFLKDMDALNVRRPTVITRVSEYIPQVLSIIQEILDNGFGYVSQGSVYFDSQKFSQTKPHVYGRMEPTAVQDASRVLEGEGELGAVSSEKKHVCDFALWKSAKPGEPSWTSPWGEGRPGWHIECSAMASSILPFPLDIHSGGIDLRFPHHDNELAQTEAAKNRPQWVNYFLHSGHLHIQGAKMSKSLKNFITIRDFLTQYSSRQLRYLCLMNRWDNFMNYSAEGETMQQAVDVDRFFANFFATVRGVLQRMEPPSNFDQRWETHEESLHKALRQTQTTVRQHLLDNFNTPDALVAIQHLASTIHVYLREQSSVRGVLLQEAAEYIFNILRLFGVVKDESQMLQYEGVSGAVQVDPFIQCLGDFRQDARALSRQVLSDLKAISKLPNLPQEHIQTATQNIQNLLKICDEVRDIKLPSLGVQLQDRSDGSFSYRLSTKEEIEQGKRLKEEDAAKKQEQRNKANEQQMRKQLERSTSPKDYFRALYPELYGSFDDEGVPLTMADGTPVSKTLSQKCAKILEKHATVYSPSS